MLSVLSRIVGALSGSPMTNAVLSRGVDMVLMRRELGDVLRAERRDQQRSLRDVSAAASVSLGYLSEIERGEKEASSELLGSICDALGMPLSVVLHELADRVAVVERLSSPVALTVSVADDFNGVSASAA